MLCGYSELRPSGRVPRLWVTPRPGEEAPGMNSGGARRTESKKPPAYLRPAEAARFWVAPIKGIQECSQPSVVWSAARRMLLAALRPD